jgi:peroxiredoxin
MPLKVGDPAPSFALYDTERNLRSLSEFLDRTTLLAFIPGAFTSVCEKELCTFRDSIGRFQNLKTNVVAISVDAPFSNEAFAVKNNLPFPLLSDFQREIIRQYDVVHVGLGGIEGYVSAKRSVFILDPNGIIRYIWIAEHPGVEPPYAEIEQFLRSL